MIKTRFAPSPTGFLHLGNVRTALYSWLFARQNNGKFLLRIEDSDMYRSSENNISNIISSMNWLNLNWDEGPYFQTKRINRYIEVINYMLANKLAYKCFCSKDRLQSLRLIQIRKGQKPKYDRYCRQTLFSSSYSLLTCDNYNIDCTIRFCNPTDGITSFNDKIRGIIKFNNQELDDLIICRSNGSPTYNFCVVIDDMDMKITHVIRGEEHINNTPRQINILKALGASVPQYAHLSMILDHKGKKLSKRHESLNVMQYRDEGFLPEAILNYLVRLGWSHGDKEIFSIKEMKKFFNFNSMSKSSSMFNLKKLLWYNYYYINNLPLKYVEKQLHWHLNKRKVNFYNGPKLINVIRLFLNRLYTLKQIADNCHYFYGDFISFEDRLVKNYLRPISIESLKIFKNKIEELQYWDLKLIKNAILETSNELNVSLNSVAMPIRVAVTGVDYSPELNKVIYTIGYIRVLKRIDKALEYIKKKYLLFFHD